MRSARIHLSFLTLLAAMVLAAPSARAQSSSLSGVVTDETGGILPDAEITVINEANNVQRTVLSNEEGLYVFAQLPPGSYNLSATQPGFNSVTIEGITLLVNTNLELSVVFDTVATLTRSITVSATAPQLNTTDASVGNAFGTKPIRQLPLNARNPAGLLSLQAGVTFLTADPLDSKLSGDIRNGTVNGAQSDQSNVTLDGVDVNDQNGRLPFTSVLRNTLDSIQEFRVVTTTANANQGRSSGAQVSLVTKSGTNEVHGSLYEYHRNTITAANDFFNNRAGVDRPKLIRNVFGGSVGGPVVKDRLFYFLNYEGRRDASDGSAVRRVPTASMRDGFVRYRSVDGVVQTLDPAFIRTRIDPLGTGPSPATLEYFRSFPEPNDSTVGDGLNTAGYRFTAPTPLTWNTFISKTDWNLDQLGSHSMFMRLNYQNDSIGSVPQFPGQPPNTETKDASRGLALGYNGLFGSSLVGTFRYGLTSQRLNFSGVQTASRASLGDSIIDDIEGATTPRDIELPTHTLSADFSVMRGTHSLQFGGAFFSNRNRRLSYDNSYHFAKQAAWALADGPAIFEGPLSAAPANPGVYRETMATALGVLNFFDANYNYDLDGNPLSLGDPVSRTFGVEQLEIYVQDTWRVRPGLAVTGGLRWSLMPPVREVNGIQVSITPGLDQYIARRLDLAANGRPTREAGSIGFVGVDDAEGGPLWSTHAKNYSPRLAVAYSPGSTEGFLGKLFGRPGRTSIRAGAGLFYNSFGMGMMQMLDRNAFGLTSKVTNQIPRVADSPRFTGLSTPPAAGILPPPPGGPGTPNPTGLGWSQGVDSSLKPPYSINPTFSLAREFGGGFLVDIGYVGRLGRRLLVNDTASAQYTNFKDPVSGQYMLDALQEMERMAHRGVPTEDVQPIRFWESLYSGVATPEATATQRVYDVIRSASPDTGTALYYLDYACIPFCSDMGPGISMNPQFWAFDALRSFGTSTYHSMQVSLRKAFSQGYQFDLNYTLSKSTDLVSVAARRSQGERFGQIPGDTYWSAFSVINSWDREAQRSVSDFDMRHQWNANWVAELPIGTGKPVLPDMGPAGQAVLGGWQLSGLMRLTSGLPLSVLNGLAWPTCYCYQHFAETDGPVPAQSNAKNARLIGGGSGPNVFSDPEAALASFRQVLPGEVGQRNNLRGDGIFSIDMAIGKRFPLPFENHSLQFRAEAFNLTNSVRFNADVWETLSFVFPGSFGNYSRVMVPPRVIQFGLRYEF
ncbi:MAG: TonB-dependent receptor [Acidobacteria bacterium]|nr:TonB-dependent receptor [Acidobacteriota bacterium]